VWTSAGATRGSTSRSRLIEGDFGADVARAVAKKLVVYHRRAGGQSQFSALLELEPKSDRIQGALPMPNAIFASKTVGDRACGGGAVEPATVQPRVPCRDRPIAGQGDREFAYRNRAPDDGAEAATRSMSSRGKPALPIVTACRRAFLRAFGQPPQVIRRNGTPRRLRLD